MKICPIGTAVETKFNISVDQLNYENRMSSNKSVPETAGHVS